jgi:serine/threonine protein kinase
MNDHVGKQLGNYRLVRMLGQGGFADVYLGEHVYLKTLAAIKILQTRLAQDDLEVFLKEARTVSNLIHPHIVRVLEFGVEGTTPFLVMDFAPNGTLRQRHPRGTRLMPVNVVPYVKQVASALQYAHDKKLIHRDIKPENMLIGQNNEVLLSDFGIALVSQSSRYQSTQEVVGTIAYMAPEQFHGKAVAASDQYALGIVIYEWLTGDRPFHGSFPEVASQHLLTPPTPLREKIGEITPAIEEVVHRAIAKDPQQRFLHVEAFANAFEQACQPTIQQLPFVALPPRPSQQPFAGNPQPPSGPYPPNQPSSPNYGAIPQQPFSSPSHGNQPVQSSPNYMPMPLSQTSDLTYVNLQGQAPSPNYGGAQTGQLGQNTSSTYSSPGAPKPPKSGTSRRGVVLALAGVTGLFVVGGAAALFELAQRGLGSSTITPTAGSGNSSTTTPATGASPTAVPTDTSTPPNGSTSPTVDTNPTVAVTPGTTVYTADWSNGMDGWAGSTDWKVLNGVLLNDGTNGNVIAGQTITPPNQLGGMSDYALETTIQVVSYSSGYRPQFGFALRGSTVSNNWQGYATAIAYIDAKDYGNTCNVQITTEDYNNQLIKTPFDPGKGKHTYRFEAKGNLLRFFIDGGNVIEVNDNRYLTGSQLGLWSYQTQLSVTSFKIIAL